MDELQKKIIVRISYDEMEGYLFLAKPPRDDCYTRSEILGALHAQNVKYGIDEDVLDILLREEQYDREVLVASGTPVQDGSDGFYEYHFATELSDKPKIREDGSVDYWDIRAIETVEEGQVIATYEEPTDGHYGMTVTGRSLTAKRGRPLSPLSGKGFDRTPDNRSYVANCSGKIEMVNNRIAILPIYEIKGDVDITTGNVDFRGDVVIHGNVATGARVTATGSVTIDGIAEGCTIEAGKDIILRKGFLGAYKGQIRTKGNVIAKFIEHATVEADGMVELTSALNCNITSYDKVCINGKTANVVGGTIFGAAGVDAYSLGTSAEVKTIIRAGISRAFAAQAEVLRQQVLELTDTVDKINAGLAQFDALPDELKDDAKKEQRVLLLRTRISKQAELADLSAKLEKTQVVLDRSRDARVRVTKAVYPGVAVEINGFMNVIKEEQSAIEFRERQGKVIMMSLAGNLVGW